MKGGDLRLPLAVSTLLAASSASAQPAAPSPYSLPWLLRPTATATVVRLDSTLATFADAAGRSGSTFVESLIVSYKVTPRLAPLFRVSFVDNSPPGAPPSGSGLSTPLLGVSYAKPLAGSWRLALFGASTLPLGSGAGDTPSTRAAAALAAGIPARSAMDNALFAVNYWTVIGGGGVARVTRGLTLQAEATVLQLTRVRGPDSQDGSQTNFTAGLHAGRFLGQRFSLGAELRIQRWLSDAAPVKRDSRARETLTFAVGPRFHSRIGGRMVRPGVSWTHALDEPLSGRGYDTFQLDVPITF